MDYNDQNAIKLTQSIGLAEGGGKFDYTNTSGDAGTSKGAYQWQPGNFEAAAKQYGLNPNDFSSKNQNAVAYNQVKSMLDKGYKPWEVAAEWNGGDKNRWQKDYITPSGLPSQGHNSKLNIDYDVPGYVGNVKKYYSQLSGGQPQTSDTTQQIPPPDTTTQIPTPTTPKPFGGKFLDFMGTLTGQKGLGEDIGGALAAKGNIKIYEDVMKSWTDVQDKLAAQIQTNKANGQDTSKLEEIFKQHADSMPNPKDFIPGVASKTYEQIFGDVAQSLLGFAGGEALSGAGKAVGTGAKILSGIKTGAILGTAFGAAGGMQEGKGLGGVAGEAALGGVGGAIGGGLLSGAGILLGKGANFIAKSNIIDKLLPQTEQRILQKENWVNEARVNIANELKKVLPLTPTQQQREKMLFQKTGDNVFSTVAKYGINVNAEDRGIGQLQQISDLYKNAINTAKRFETGYFNVDDIVKNASMQIDKNIKDAEERLVAKNRIARQIRAIKKEDPRAFIKDVNGNTKVTSKVVERLRDVGNSWTNFDVTDPQKIGQSTGYALSNAVRGQVEKEGTFPSYRYTNAEWGKVIHAQEILSKSGTKSFKVPGGLSGSITRRILSGVIGYHTAGLGGAILGEMGSEYGAQILSNPELRTYFDRKLIERFGDKKPTPELISQLENEVKQHIDFLKKGGQLGPGAIPMGPETMKPANVVGNNIKQGQQILQNTLQLDAPEPRTIVPNTQGTPNQPGVDYGTPEVGGMRQKKPI